MFLAVYSSSIAPNSTKISFGYPTARYNSASFYHHQIIEAWMPVNANTSQTRTYPIKKDVGENRRSEPHVSMQYNHLSYYQIHNKSRDYITTKSHDALNLAVSTFSWSWMVIYPGILQLLKMKPTKTRIPPLNAGG